ncbi:MAG: response regulator [Thermodesulfobacteriota bacterium]
MSDKILIVDDSPSTLMLMKFSLEKHGFFVRQASDGEKALLVLKENNDVRCMITDINMPGINGIVLINEVRKLENYKFLPVIVLSNPDNPENKKKARHAGAAGWLDKPFRPDNLIKVIKKTGIK